MKRILILLAAISLSCANAINHNNEKEIAELEKSDSSMQEILLGEFHKEDLQEKPFSSWFEPKYENFSPETEAMATIEKNIGDYQIKVLMGTWCGDSKREVPKLLKILDNANYDYKNLEMIAVDYNKTTPSKIEEELGVHHVPTIIFYKDGKEVNRFVEYSQEETLEEDIAKIVSGKSYKNSYED
jgi:thiol-disulfide isomerase/thioredoxin